MNGKKKIISILVVLFVGCNFLWNAMSVPSDRRSPKPFVGEHGFDGGHATVFIGIKTAETGPHGERLPQIRDTWLKDALNEGIDIKFFTHGTKTKRPVDEDQAADLQSLIVGTDCRRVDLCCKTGAVFKYFLERHADTKTSFFCSFDDDNYVLVHNLLRVLTSYQLGPRKGHDLYIGGKRLGQGTQTFLTGGAGYCLNRELLERGNFSSFAKFCHDAHLPDDVAVGHLAHNILGVELTEDERFHSHLESDLRVRLPKEDISKQVSFGYNNKKNRVGETHNRSEAFPDIPVMFSSRDDPLLFKSLRCFLIEGEPSDTAECRMARRQSHQSL